MKQPQKIALVIILAMTFILGLIIGWPLQMLTVYPPGWEMKNKVGAVRHNDVIMDSEEDFTHPRELMGVYWKVDWDNENYQVPTVEIQMGDLRHVDFMGKETPSTKPADSIMFERGNMSYYLDYHIYMYTVTVRTIADKNEVKNDWWEHETSWPWNQYNKLSGTGVNEKLGEKFAGGVYVKFIIDPWQGFTYRDPPPSENPEEEWYALEGCWAGVMNTYVADRRLGQVENQWGDSPDPDDDAQKFVGAGLDEGNQVPMLLDDGAYGSPAPDIDWDPTVTPDEDIESSVVQYLPIEMQPGADIDYDRWGYAIALNPCDVYVMYTLRVDVLTSHGFSLHTAKEPPEPEPPSDFYDWSLSFWEGVFESLGMMNPFRFFGPFAPLVAFLALIMVLGIVALILLAIFAPGALMLLRGAASQKEKR